MERPSRDGSASDGSHIARGIAWGIRRSMGLFRHIKRGWTETSRLYREPPKLPGPFASLSKLAVQSASTATEAAAASRQGARYLLARMPFKIRWLIAAPMMGLAVAALSLGAMMVYYTAIYPNPLTLRNKDHAPVVRVLARDGSVLAERGAGHEYVPLDFLPRHVEAAVVATEDRRFFDHYGLDPIGLVRAFFTNLRAGRFAQGGSTLTQQLAKNLFLSSERTLSRKLEELGLALWLELRLSKSDILELYLNRVYFGGGAYGIEAASRRYFDKSARELSIGEAALIAGLLKAPSKYSPTSSPGLARARGRVVLDNMVEAGLITDADRRRSLATRIVFHEPQNTSDADGAGYAVDFILEKLPALMADGDAELIVETTLDANLQRVSYDAVATALGRQGKILDASQAAVVVMDVDGGIRAMVGGRNYTESQFNRAVKARRQPGSAFKPFVYLASIEAGLRPDSMTFDQPLMIDGWTPRNDNGSYVGQVTLRRALAQSINTVAARLNHDTGVKRTIGAAHRLGLRSELREEPSLALGTSEVNLLELVGGYAVFGNGGMAVEPHVISRVRLGSGRILFARTAQRSTTVVSSDAVGAMNDMLNAAVVSGTGRRAAISLHPTAGKTGTTQDFRDAWFVGYTSHLAAGVWIGNDNGRPMKQAVGGGLPAEIWHQIMAEAHRGKAPLSLPGTQSDTGRTIAVVSGQPARTLVRASWVDMAAEHLPWLAKAKGDAAEMARPSAPPAAALSLQPMLSGPLAAEPSATVASHPKEPIDDAFLDRVLNEAEALPAVPRREPERQSGFLPFSQVW